MRAWIFDLDGTLAQPMHDFTALKATLGLPTDRDVLAGIASRPAAERPALNAAVAQWERDHLADARPAPGAARLLDAVAAAGQHRGVLTRNTRATALATLSAIDLRDRFDDADVVGRQCARPKPDPAGILRLLGAWGVVAGEAVMVGDHVHDLQAARAAGVHAVWIDHGGSGRFAAQADRVVLDLAELLPLVR